MRNPDDHLVLPVKKFKGFKKLESVRAVKKIQLDKTNKNARIKALNDFLDPLPAGQVAEIWVCGGQEISEITGLLEEYKCILLEALQQKEYSVLIIKKEEIWN